MPKISVSSIIEAPISRVWDAWDDYGRIDQFNPNIIRSFLINNSASTGLGATRQCDLADGKNYIRERIIDYVPERRMVVDIYDGTIPLKSAIASIEMRPLGSMQTELSFTMEFTPKMGLIGRLLTPVMKPQFRKQISGLLTENRKFVESLGMPAST